MIISSLKKLIGCPVNATNWYVYIKGYWMEIVVISLKNSLGLLVLSVYVML